MAASFRRANVARLNRCLIQRHTWRALRVGGHHPLRFFLRRARLFSRKAVYIIHGPCSCGHSHRAARQQEVAGSAPHNDAFRRASLICRRGTYGGSKLCEEPVCEAAFQASCFCLGMFFVVFAAMFAYARFCPASALPSFPAAAFLFGPTLFGKCDLLARRQQTQNRRAKVRRVRRQAGEKTRRGSEPRLPPSPVRALISLCVASRFRCQVETFHLYGQHFRLAACDTFCSGSFSCA